MFGDFDKAIVEITRLREVVRDNTEELKGFRRDLSKFTLMVEAAITVMRANRTDRLL